MKITEGNQKLFLTNIEDIVEGIEKAIKRFLKIKNLNIRFSI